MPTSNKFTNPKNPIALQEKSSSVRLNTVEADVYTSLNTLDDDVNRLETVLGLAADDEEADIIYSSTNIVTSGQDLITAIGALDDHVSNNLSQILPVYYNASGIPTYASANTVTVSHIACKDSTRAFDINKNTSTTLNLTSTGLNGVAQSSDLTGSVTVTAGSATVSGSGTAFLTNFQVGDVVYTVGGQGRRITSITNNTTMTASANFSSSESGVTYKRGGEAPSTCYHVYAIDDGTTPGLIMSTRNVTGGDTLADLPTGYTRYRQFAYEIDNDSSGNIIPVDVIAGWPYRPLLKFRVNIGDAGTVSDYNIVNNSTGGTYTVGLENYLSPNCRRVSMKMDLSRWGSDGYLRLDNKGDTNESYSLYCNSFSINQTADTTIGVDSNGDIQYFLSTNCIGKMWLTGKYVTEVVA